MSDLDAVRLKALEDLFEAFNRHDAQAVMETMTEDIVFDTAAGPQMWGRRIVGSADVRAAFERTFSDFPDVTWQCTRHAVFGDRGISEWIFRATTNDRSRIEAEGCDLFGFRGAKIFSKSAFRKDRPLQPTQAAQPEYAGEAIALCGLRSSVRSARERGAGPQPGLCPDVLARDRRHAT